ncbi:MAG: 50S ribosomal protein L3 N(5)-glutamine methyltransferase [Comamonadaceae bacterium]|nr:MAG: 50S ribosomal protein L3 N(5)-glutamine methyltransferase [Comamonadaceae bacterium]
MTLIELVNSCAKQLDDAHLSFGHGTQNAFDEAAWLVLWRLGLSIDSALDQTGEYAEKPISQEDVERVEALVRERIQTRKPAAYLTHEAWLQGFAFYVDERVIVPRSLIAELLVNGGIDYFLSPSTHKVLDLCTGNGSLGIIAAQVFPDIEVTGADLSEEALSVARINVDKYQLQERMVLVQSDGFNAAALQARGPFDLIVCNPPYVNAQSMAALPPEYLAEPAIALDGNTHGGSDGMDFVRSLLRDVAVQLSPQGVLVLEIGNERPYFEAAFPLLEVVWLETSAGEDQVCLITHASLTP